MRSFVRVAIDGPAGAGKSTVAKKVADVLHMTYIDTGAMYRAVTWGILSQKIDIEDKHRLEEYLLRVRIEFRDTCQSNGKKQLIYFNGQNITSEIRTPEVTEYVSQIASIPMVRQAMVQLQREMAINQNVVMDGRDIGTYVFPDAEFKFFLTASIEERTKRRYDELRQKGESSSYNEVKQSILMRDHLDSHREMAPLKPAEDAIIVDTSCMTVEEVVEMIVSEIQKKTISAT